MATKLESTVTNRLLTLTEKFAVFVRNTDVLKRKFRTRTEAAIHLGQSILNMQYERERDRRTINELKLQSSSFRDAKDNLERVNQEYRMILDKLKGENADVNGKIRELHKDLKEATLIITQKTKAHEEMAADLVQANSMLVNFTNHYDNMSKELKAVKATLAQTEQESDDKTRKYNELESTFDKYKSTFNHDEVEQMKLQVYQTNKLCEELDKKNKEINKLNSLLSRKLAESGDCAGQSISDSVTPTNAPLRHHIQRTNHRPWQPKGQF